MQTVGLEAWGLDQSYHSDGRLSRWPDPGRNHHNQWREDTRLLVLPLPLTSGVTINKAHSCSGPQFSHLCNGERLAALLHFASLSL